MLDEIVNLIDPHYFWFSLNELTMTITKLVNQIVAYLPQQKLSSLFTESIAIWLNLSDKTWLVCQYSAAVDMLARSVRVVSDSYMDMIGIFHLEKRNKLPPITSSLLLKPAIELSNLIRTGQLSCETLLNTYIKRIGEVNGKINALVNDCFEQALEEAKAYDTRIIHALNNPDQTEDNVLSLPLLGIPISIKESIAVKGLPLTGGLVSRKDTRAEEDSEAITNLRNSGAIVVGTTNVPEFLLWWDSNNKVYGRTNNPYDLSRISGGSSGGEGALISSAGSLIGLGSDIGGSIRIPSFLCGVFGHKPSSNTTTIHGTYPYVGHPDREKFFSLGPICRYAVDLKCVLKSLVGQEMSSLLKLDESVDLNKCKFYFLLNDGDPLKSKVSGDIVEAINNARDFLQNNCGFECLDANLPLFRYSFFMWATSLSDMDTPLLSSELMERKGEMNGFRELAKSFFGASHFRSLSALNVIIESILYDRENSRFRKFCDKTIVFKSQLESLLDDNSILIMPCLPQKAPKHNGTFLRMNNCGYTAILNICEVPATQVSMGLGRNSGMPVGFQVVAKRLNDRYTLAVAELLAKRFGGWQPPCGVQLP